MLEVVVGVANGGEARALAEVLEKTNNTILGSMPPGWLLVKLCEELQPEVAVVEFNGCGLELTRVLSQELGVAVVGVGPALQPGLAKEGASVGLRGYIPRPINIQLLPAMVKAAYFGWEQLELIKRQLHQLQEWDRLHVPLEMAKGLIMARKGLSPRAAEAYLKKLAKTKGVSLKELVEQLSRNSK